MFTWCSSRRQAARCADSKRVGADAAPSLVMVISCAGRANAPVRELEFDCLVHGQETDHACGCVASDPTIARSTDGCPTRPSACSPWRVHVSGRTSATSPSTARASWSPSTRASWRSSSRRPRAAAPGCPRYERQPGTVRAPRGSRDCPPTVCRSPRRPTSARAARASIGGVGVDRAHDQDSACALLDGADRSSRPVRHRRRSRRRRRRRIGEHGSGTAAGRR